MSLVACIFQTWNTGWFHQSRRGEVSIEAIGSKTVELDHFGRFNQRRAVNWSPRTDHALRRGHEKNPVIQETS